MGTIGWGVAHAFVSWSMIAGTAAGPADEDLAGGRRSAPAVWTSVLATMPGNLAATNAPLLAVLDRDDDADGDEVDGARQRRREEGRRGEPGERAGRRERPEQDQRKDDGPEQAERGQPDPLKAIMRMQEMRQKIQQLRRDGKTDEANALMEKAMEEMRGRFSQFGGHGGPGPEARPGRGPHEAVGDGRRGPGAPGGGPFGPGRRDAVGGPRGPFGPAGTEGQGRVGPRRRGGDGDERPPQFRQQPRGGRPAVDGRGPTAGGPPWINQPQRGPRGPQLPGSPAAHVRLAVQQLHLAGMHELAEEVAAEARRRFQPVGQRDLGEIQEQLDRLNDQVAELGEHVERIHDELHEVLGRGEHDEDAHEHLHHGDDDHAHEHQEAHEDDHDEDHEE